MYSSHNNDECDNSLVNLEKDVGKGIFEYKILNECDSELALAESALHETTNKSVEKNSFALSLEISNNVFKDILTSKIATENETNHEELKEDDNISEDFNYLFKQVYDIPTEQKYGLDQQKYEDSSECKEGEAMFRNPSNPENCDKILQDTFNDNVEFSSGLISFDSTLLEDENDITVIQISDNVAEDINDKTLTKDESFDKETKKTYSPNTLDNNYCQEDKKISNSFKLNNDEPLSREKKTLPSPNTTITLKDNNEKVKNLKLSNDALFYKETKTLYSATNTIVSQKNKPFSVEKMRNLNFPLKLNNSLLSDISDGDFSITDTINENSLLNKEIIVSGNNDADQYNRNYSMKPNETITFWKNAETNSVKPKTIIAADMIINLCDTSTDTQYSSIELKNTIKFINNDINVCNNDTKIQKSLLESKATIVSEKETKQQNAPIETIVSDKNVKKISMCDNIPNNKRETPQFDCLTSAYNKKRKVSTTSSTRIININNNKSIALENNASDTSEINYTKAIFDPDETADHNDPKWSVLKELKTAEDYFNSVRTQWRSLILPNPHTDLTKRYVSVSSIKPLPTESTEHENVVSCMQYLNQRISTLNKTLRNLNSKLNIITRSVNRRRNDRYEISKLTNDIEKLNAEIHGIEKNQEEVKQINKYYTESVHGWNANYSGVRL